MNEQDERNAGVNVEYEAPPGAHYGKHHLDRFAQAGATNREVGQLASELEALPLDEREARIERLAQLSNQDLAGELERRRKGEEDGRDPAEVGAELGAPLSGGAGDGGGGDGEEVDLNATGSHTVDEVVDAVGSDPAKARQALESEQGRSRPRSTLVDELQKIIDDEE